MVKLWIYFIVGFIAGKFARKFICLVRDFIIKLRNRRITVITLDDAEYGETVIGVAKTEKQMWRMLWEAYDDLELYFDDNGSLTRKNKDFIPYHVEFNLDYIRLNQYDKSTYGSSIGYEIDWKKPD